MHRLTALGLTIFFAIAWRPTTFGQQQQDARAAALKQDIVNDIDTRYDATQQMIDMVFSFGELGYQEVDLSGILEKSWVVCLYEGVFHVRPSATRHDAAGLSIERQSHRRRQG